MFLFFLIFITEVQRMAAKKVIQSNTQADIQTIKINSFSQQCCVWQHEVDTYSQTSVGFQNRITKNTIQSVSASCHWRSSADNQSIAKRVFVFFFLKTPFFNVYKWQLDPWSRFISIWLFPLFHWIRIYCQVCIRYWEFESGDCFLDMWRKKYIIYKYIYNVIWKWNAVH